MALSRLLAAAHIRSVGWCVLPPSVHLMTRRMRIAPMNDTFQGTRFLRAVGMTLALALLVWAPAFTQQPVEVSGTVTSAVGGRPVSGVTVRVRGSHTSTVTDAQGKYTLAVPPDAVLVFSLIGYRQACDQSRKARYRDPDIYLVTGVALQR